MIAYRSQRRRQVEETWLLERYRDLVTVLTQLNDQLSNVLIEQQTLLREQRDLLQALLRQQRNN